MKSFAEMKERLTSLPQKKRLGVVAAQDHHTLDAVVRAAQEGLVEPVLLGDARATRELLREFGFPEAKAELIDIASSAECAKEAARLVKAGKLDCLMKGKIETGTLMRVMVNKEEGIRKGETMSAVSFFESPYYHKLFAITDAGLLPHPTLAQKYGVIENAVEAFHTFGTTTPKVAVLAAVEHVDLKMPETLDAEAIKQQWTQGKLTGCIVEGPVSYDLAMSQEAAVVKGYQSPVAGDADILVVPDLVCGNSLFKCLAYTGGAKFAGAVFGAKVPLILTSRSSSMADKYQSILLNALVGQGQK